MADDKDVMPEPGTEKFAQWLSDHFVSLVDALRDLVGEDAFGEHAAFAVGVRFQTKAGGRLRENLFVNARGNVTVSVRMLADLADLAAMELSLQGGTTREQALAQVLNAIKHELLTKRRDMPPTSS